MTRTTNARLAGFMFLFYIVTGVTSMVLSRQATGGAEETAAKLASIAQHAPLVRLIAVLAFLMFVDAVVLAVALYGLTRDQDRDLAVLALSCRVSEGMIGAIAAIRPSRQLVALLNRHLARDPEVVEISVSGSAVIARRRQGGAPLDRLYGAAARSATELLASGDPHRLRKCANPSCRLMFYDVSKAGRRRWCSMQTCGARAKVRAFYRRRRGPRT